MEWFVLWFIINSIVGYLIGKSKDDVGTAITVSIPAGNVLPVKLAVMLHNSKIRDWVRFVIHRNPS
jgi:hypothetical protein